MKDCTKHTRDMLAVDKTFDPCENMERAKEKSLIIFAVIIMKEHKLFLLTSA